MTSPRYIASRFAASTRLRRLSRARIERVKLYNRSAIQLGMDCRIEYGAILDARRGELIEIGERSAIRAHAILESQGSVITVGDHSLVNSNTHVFGNTLIEDLAIIGPGCTINAHQHSFDAPTPIRNQPVIIDPVVIGRGAWVGANVVLMTGVTVGEGAIVGAGSIVTRDVPPNSIAVGVPAKVVGQRPDMEPLRVPST